MSGASIVDAASLRAARAEQGLSVRALARLSGVSRSTIERCESSTHGTTQAVLDRLTFALRSDAFAIKCAELGIEPGSREELFHVVPWELDPVSQELVRSYPDGMTYQEIAEVTGLDWRTVAEIERNALEKLRAQDLDRLREYLESEPIHHHTGPVKWPKPNRDELDSRGMACMQGYDEAEDQHR